MSSDIVVLSSNKLKSQFRDFFIKFLLLLKNPRAFFQKAGSEETVHPAIFFLVTLTFITSVINVLITTPLMINKIGSFASVTWPAQLLTILYSPLYSLFYSGLVAGLVFIILKIIKTKKNRFRDNFKLVLYSQAVMLPYLILGTVLVLIAELASSQGVNEMLFYVLSASLASVSGTIILYLIFAIPLTIASWVHLLWVLMHGFTVSYDIKKTTAVIISIVSLLLVSLSTFALIALLS